MTDNIREWFIGQNETKRVSIRFYHASPTRSSIKQCCDTHMKKELIFVVQKFPFIY